MLPATRDVCLSLEWERRWERLWQSLGVYETPRVRVAPGPPGNLLNTRTALPPPTRRAKHKLGF